MELEGLSISKQNLSLLILIVFWDMYFTRRPVAEEYVMDEYENSGIDWLPSN